MMATGAGGNSSHWDGNVACQCDVNGDRILDVLVATDSTVSILTGPAEDPTDIADSPVDNSICNDGILPDDTACDGGDDAGDRGILDYFRPTNGTVAEGKLQAVSPVEARVVYHDSCYLGRYNDIYDSPRRLLAGIPGVELVEASRNRDRGMCCGAGGAQFFKEEEKGDERVNFARADELLETGANVVGTACPFCKCMLSDGVAARDRDDDVKLMDVAELLWQAVEA